MNLSLILILVSGCAGFNSDLQGIILGNTETIPKVDPVDQNKILNERITVIERELDIIRLELENLRPNVEELKAIDEDIRKLLSNLTKVKSENNNILNKESKNNLKENNFSNKEKEVNTPITKNNNNEPISLSPKKTKITNQNDQLGIHLASFKTIEAARKGWNDIINSQGDLLFGLNYKISKVDLPNKKGIYYRLKAGPYIDRNIASESCKILKSRNLYCKITDFIGEK